MGPTNFEKLKETFKRETGLDPKDNMQTYVAYYQAKMIELALEVYCKVNKISIGGR